MVQVLWVRCNSATTYPGKCLVRKIAKYLYVTMYTCWNSGLYILVSSRLFISSSYASYSLLFLRMTRKYVCESNRGKTPTDILERAVKLVIEEKRTVRFVPGQFGICHVTLSRYVTETKEIPEEQNLKGGFAKHKQVLLNNRRSWSKIIWNSQQISILDLLQWVLEGLHMIVLHRVIFEWTTKCRLRLVCELYEETSKSFNLTTWGDQSFTGNII